MMRYLVPAVAMSLGWGIRGQFGGPRGAMIPGAIMALVLLLVARGRFSVRQTWLILAAGTLGFAIGGEETYGQTIGWTKNRDLTIPYWNSDVAWGYLGLALKGAVWFGLGGLFIGWAAAGRRRSTGELLLALNIALAVSFLGFWLINEPKLIYFSGGSGKPRMEGWAGLWGALVGLLLLAAKAREREAARLSLWGIVGGGLGFPGGQLINALGDRWFTQGFGAYLDWWKGMECGFGLIGGFFLAIGWARIALPAPEPDEPPRIWPVWLYLILLADLVLFFWVADFLDGFGGWIGKAPFLFIAPTLFLACARAPQLGLIIGAAVTIGVTLMDIQLHWVGQKALMSVPASLPILAAGLAAAALHVRSLACNHVGLLVAVVWWSIAAAWVKIFWPIPQPPTGPLITQCAFVLMGIFITWAALRGSPHAASSAGDSTPSSA